MKKLSLTGRLTAVVVGSQFLLAIGLVLVGMLYLREELLSGLDLNLQGRAHRVAALAYYAPKSQTKLLFDADESPASSDPAHPDMYQITSERLGFENHTQNFNSALPQKLASRRTKNFKWNGVPYRAVVLRNLAIRDPQPEIVGMPDATLTVIYAAPTLAIDREVAEVGFGVASASIFILALTGFLASWALRRGLSPLRDLASRAGSISVSNWEFRPSPEALDAPELAPLTQAIQTVLARLEKSFTQQRGFLADAAHELKTSVAIVKSTFQSLLQSPRSPQEYREGLQQLLEDVERLEDLLNRMLRLARAEQWAAEGLQGQFDNTDITSTCEMAIARIKSLAASRDVKVELMANGTAELPADPADLELVWVNLLENAIQHSPAGSAVRMRLEVETVSACVSVEDSGSGIAPDQLPYIFERFRRGDPSRARATGGFGLGLAIAKAIVDAYRGNITASSVLGQGTRISVQLPLVRDAKPNANREPVSVTEDSLA